ncbi:Target of rapamycin complex 2 subunit bit61 [Pseudocercospora fuligena]|uniref:Target of rapamycin complex 2 subunit bit61 n=1 Tax=Pseudocercospora fuligena TaxID=685502 RepID=A0A8H6R7M5_9PEZI|nr:Target of rapamycin complex 2 subunit bit61 [Pseudocercospora fuligena]
MPSSLSQASLRSESSLSNASIESGQTNTQPALKRSPYIQQQPPTRPSTAGGLTPSQSTTTLQGLQGLPRHAARGSVDGTLRTVSPMPGQQIGHRARQHSQGFFEPSLPHATANNNGLTASQIAAQAAMHNISPPPSNFGERKRSYPGLAPINTTGPAGYRRPSYEHSPQSQFASAGPLAYSNGTVGGSRLAATTAANVAFPNGRSPLPSPGVPPPTQNIALGPPIDKEPKTKTSKMKLFKPKNINLSKEKDGKIAPSVPSPGKTPSTATFLRSGFPNASTTSLVDPSSNGSSLYSSANASTSTLVPNMTEKDKEKRHHFLSRQKHKMRDEPNQLPLSSAHSNSQATNPDKPQPLYSFTPDSPSIGPFAKSMSGFDLRHGGRALREKKKEEKAAAAAAKLDLTPIVSNTSATGAESFLGPPSSYEASFAGPPSGTTSVFSFPSETTLPVTAQAFSNIGAQMGLPGIGPDDAWPLLKARLLNLFSGESLRTPIEDFNALVSVHVRRCIQRRSPIVLVEDVRELLQTGFSSLAQTLRGVPDDRIVTHLVEMWTGVYGAILPFLQAVFLPLELEFKGRGNLMSAREAQEFWGAIPEALKSDDRPSSAGGTSKPPNLHDELEIRRITLITFRDEVILPKHESLMNIFSRLSLENINAGGISPDMSNFPSKGGREHARSDPATTGAERPGTAGSLSPRLASFNSQTSTLLDAASTAGSGGAMSLASRSRATSNTSAGSFGTSMPHLNSPLGPGSFSATSQPSQPPATVSMDPAKVTETVARMLQCLYVVASCQTGDLPQGNVERLVGALKYNWLGRGRTGRDRRGWVPKRAAGRVGLVGA